MIKPDVLITWPSGCDYPLCRLQLKLFRKYYKDVIITFYDHGQPDFKSFIQWSHRDFKFVFSPETSVAWREAAVNKGLEVSKSDYVLFTEQDFFIKEDAFMEKVLAAAEKYDTVGIRQGNRLHPCFLLTKRSLVDQTSKDFAVQGENKDHFQKFSEEILNLGTFIDLTDLGLFSGRDYFHFSSLTWNLFRIKDEEVREMHEPENFLIYNYLSRTNRVPQDPRWIAFTYFAEMQLSTFGSFLNK